MPFAALVLAIAPVRWWPWLDRYAPVSRLAVPSALLTIIAGGTLGIVGFISFSQRQASAINDAILTGPSGAGAIGTFELQSLAAISPLAFLLTPSGVAAVYFVLSGLVRALAGAFAEPVGDPLLTAVDGAIVRAYRGAERMRMSRARERDEGPEVPDRILRGVHLGLGADLVIVSSRRKPDWDQGTIVRSGKRWFRVGVVEERVLAGRLRTLYPPSVLRDHAAIRRQVTYAIPEKYLRPDDTGDGA